MTSSLWNHIGDVLGKTIFHPQYPAKQGEYFAVEYLKKHAHGVFLDIGCGRQPHRAVLEPRVTRYLALDHPQYIPHYQSPFPVEIASDARHIPLPDASVDTCMMLWVVEHVKDPDAVFSEVCRVIRPDGLFVIYFVENYPAHGFPPNYQRYTSLGMKRLLARHGLRIVRTISFGTVWETLVLYQNVWAMELVKWVMFEKHLMVFGLLLLLLFSPFMVAGNGIAFLLRSVRLPHEFALGHVTIARRKRDI